MAPGPVYGADIKGEGQASRDCEPALGTTFPYAGVSRYHIESQM